MVGARHEGVMPTNLSDIDFSQIAKTLALDDKSHDANVDKNFIEKHVFITPNNTEFIKFDFLQIPNYVNLEGETTTKHVLGLLSDGTIGVYSMSSGNLLQQIDLSSYNGTIQNLDITFTDNWVSDVVDFKPINAGSDFAFLLLTRKGEVIIVHLELKHIKDQSINASFKNATDKTDKRKSAKQTVTRTPKHIEIKDIEGFNVWDTIISTNSTLYGEEISYLKKNNVEALQIEFFGRNFDGNFIIADSMGHFNIFRKQQLVSKNQTTTAPLFKLTTRADSGFKSLDIIERLNMLTIFASENKIGFIRAYDGQVASTTCEIGTSVIRSISHDKQNPGRFYVGTNTGEVIAFEAKPREKNDMSCDIVGKLVGEETVSHSLHSLKQYLVKYNITNAKLDPTVENFAKVNFSKYKLESVEKERGNSTSSELKSMDFAMGNHLLARVPGSKNKLVMLDVLNKDIKADSWVLLIVENKAIVFAVCIVIVVGYKLMQVRSSNSKKIPSKGFRNQRDDSGLTSDSLRSLQEKLAGLGQKAEHLDKVEHDLRGLGGGNRFSKPKTNRLGNKVRFLEE